MNKKLRFWMYAASGVILAAIVVWACRPEYGSGYSEERRHIWNTTAETFGDSGAGVNGCIYRLLQSTLPEEAPEWRGDLSESLPELPLEGMSIPMLKMRAERGDGDACLELAVRSFELNTPYCYQEKGNFFPSPQSVYMTETYVKKAAELGRPGAEFLLRLVKNVKKGGEFQIRDDAEYQFFSSLLEQGDFLSGKLFLYLYAEDGNVLLDRLGACLRKRAEQGDIDSLRNAGQLALLQKLRGRPSLYWGDLLMSLSHCKLFNEWRVRLQSCENEMEVLFPEWAPIWGKTKDKVDCWFEAREWKMVQDELEEPLSMLHQAAERGDLHARFLWSQYAVCLLHSFSEKEWEQCLKYFEETVQAGGDYADQFLDLQFSSKWFLSFFYQKPSIDHFEELIWKRKGKGYLSFDRLSEDAPLFLWMDAEAERNIEYFTWVVIRDMFRPGNNWTEEARKYACRLIEASGREGHPVSMFYWAWLMEDGKIMKESPSQSWEVLMRLKAWCGEGINVARGYSRVNVHLKDGDFKCDHELKEAVKLQMLDMVSRRGNMTGMTVEEAFDLFLHDFYRNRRYRKNRDLCSQLQLLGKQFEQKGFRLPDVNQ